MSTVLTNGNPVPEDGSHMEINPATGMQRSYVVLTEEERRKGFVKPVRESYRHVGLPAPTNLRDLTAEEHARYDKYYGADAQFEEYGSEREPLVGKFWKREELERIKNPCNSVTTMGRSIAETYARDPGFYGGTFCYACRKHLPLNEFVWEPDGEPMDISLQAAWHVEHAERLQHAQEQLKAARKQAWERRCAQLRAELKRLEEEGPL